MSALTYSHGLPGILYGITCPWVIWPDDQDVGQLLIASSMCAFMLIWYIDSHASILVFFYGHMIDIYFIYCLVLE